MDNEITQVTGKRPPPPPHGEIVFREFIGRGATSELYRADNLLAESSCAAKLLHAPISARVVARGRYLDELRRIDKLDVPAVAPTFRCEAGGDGRVLVCRRWIEAPSLSQLLDGRVLHRRQYQPLIRALATALAPIHRAGYAHRRLHGGNIFVDWRGREPSITLVDFGVWQIYPAVDELADLGPQCAAFTAPEVARDRRAGDPRSDIYSLAAILYQAVTGRSVFNAASYAEQLDKQINEYPQPPSAIAEVSAELDQVILRGLDKDPRRRPASVEAMLSALDPLWTTTGSYAAVGKARGIQTLTTGEIIPGEIEADSKQMLAPLNRGRRRLLVISGAVVVALLATVAAVLIATSGDDEPARSRIDRPARTAVRRPLRRSQPIRRQDFGRQPSPPPRGRIAPLSTPANQPQNAQATVDAGVDASAGKAKSARFSERMVRATARFLGTSPAKLQLRAAHQSGGIDIKVDKDVEVILDGRSLGRGPRTIGQLRPGKRRIEARNKKGETIGQKEVIVSGGQTTTVEF